MFGSLLGDYLDSFEEGVQAGFQGRARRTGFSIGFPARWRIVCATLFHLNLF